MKKRGSLMRIAALYALGVALRYALAVLLTQNPSIMPDESLYANLARSLWNARAVSYRGMAINYDSLLYPLLLSPLYGLPSWINIYRAAQLLNALLINLAAFPAWGLALRVTKDKRAALFCAALSIALPDLAMAQLLMVESVAYPLMTLSFLLLYRLLLNEGGAREACLFGLCGFLLYFAKPGLVALGVCGCLALWLRAARGAGQRGAVSSAACATLVLAGLCLLSRVWLSPLMARELQSLYGLQTAPLTPKHLFKTVQGLLLYFYFFAFAAGVFPLLAPLTGAKRLEPRERTFYGTVALALLVTAAGACYVIYVDELTASNAFDSRVHLRYLFYFLPVLVMGALAPALKGAKLNAGMLCLLALLLVSSGPIGLSALAVDRASTTDSLLLAPIAAQGGEGARGALQAALLLWIVGGGAYLWRRGYDRRFRGASLGLLCAWLIACNVCGYQGLIFNAEADWARDARETAAAADAKGGAIFVAKDGGLYWNAATALDLHSRQGLPMVELGYLIDHTLPDGSFAAFPAQSHWVALAEGCIERPDELIVERRTFKALNLAPGVGFTQSMGRNYVTIKMPGEGPWLASAMSHLDQGYVAEGSRVTFYAGSIRGPCRLTIRFNTFSEAGGVLAVACGGRSAEARVPQGAAWVALQLELPRGEGPRVVSLSASGRVFLEDYGSIWEELGS